MKTLSVLSCRRHKLCDLLLQHRLHLLVLQVVCDGGEEVSRVVALQQAAAVGESSHDGFIVAEDLQTAEEQRFTLASWHHHLREGNLPQRLESKFRKINIGSFPNI